MFSLSRKIIVLESPASLALGHGLLASLRHTADAMSTPQDPSRSVKPDNILPHETVWSAQPRSTRIERDMGLLYRKMGGPYDKAAA